MNYTYEIQVFSNGVFRLTQPIVKESKDKETPNLWSLLTLLSSTEIRLDSHFQASLGRTKEWLKKNHPEISMKFMIFKNGIYDANYQGADSIVFWKFSELNDSYITDQDWKILSFNRTKKWLIENHPELII